MTYDYAKYQNKYGMTAAMYLAQKSIAPPEYYQHDK